MFSDLFGNCGIDCWLVCLNNMHVLTKLCVFRVFSFPCFLFLSFPSDRDYSTKWSVNTIGKNGVTFWFPGVKRPHTHQPSEKLHPLQQWCPKWDRENTLLHTQTGILLCKIRNDYKHLFCVIHCFSLGLVTDPRAPSCVLLYIAK